MSRGCRPRGRLAPNSAAGRRAAGSPPKPPGTQNFRPEFQGARTTRRAPKRGSFSRLRQRRWQLRHPAGPIYVAFSVDAFMQLTDICIFRNNALRLCSQPNSLCLRRACQAPAESHVYALPRQINQRSVLTCLGRTLNPLSATRRETLNKLSKRRCLAHPRPKLLYDHSGSRMCSRQSQPSMLSRSHA